MLGGPGRGVQKPVSVIRTCLLHTHMYVPQRGHKISTYYQRHLLSGLVYVHEVRIHRGRMRSTYYPGVCTKPGTYYQGWLMYMRYTQGQNEESLLSRSM